MSYQLPPLLPYPGDDASPDAMNAYITRMWMHREVALADAATGALAAHRSALEAAAKRNAAAMEEMARIAEVGLYTEGAMSLLADRTSATSSDTLTGKELADSVRDAKATVDAIKALLAPAPAPAPAPDPVPPPAPPGEVPPPGISG